MLQTSTKREMTPNLKMKMPLFGLTRHSGDAVARFLPLNFESMRDDAMRCDIFSGDSRGKVVAANHW